MGATGRAPRPNWKASKLWWLRRAYGPTLLVFLAVGMAMGCGKIEPKTVGPSTPVGMPDSGTCEPPPPEVQQCECEPPCNLHHAEPEVCEPPMD